MYFYLGYDNQALSISYELAKESRPFPTTQIILSLKTIHVLLLSSQKTDLTFKLNSTGNQPNYCISKNILKYINLETIDTTKGDQNYSEYLEYLEFPLECYQSLLKRIIKPETTKIFIFTNKFSQKY